jgi:hypothetical protein
MAKPVTDLFEIVEPLIQLVGLSPDELADMGTWRAPRSLDPGDLTNLNEREPEPLRPGGRTPAVPLSRLRMCGSLRSSALPEAAFLPLRRGGSPFVLFRYVPRGRRCTSRFAS